MRQDCVREEDEWTMIEYKKETIKRSGHGIIAIVFNST